MHVILLGSSKRTFDFAHGHLSCTRKVQWNRPRRLWTGVGRLAAPHRIGDGVGAGRETPSRSPEKSIQFGGCVRGESCSLYKQPMSMKGRSSGFWIIQASTPSQPVLSV